VFGDNRPYLVALLTLDREEGMKLALHPVARVGFSVRWGGRGPVRRGCGARGGSEVHRRIGKLEMFLACRHLDLTPRLPSPRKGCRKTDVEVTALPRDDAAESRLSAHVNHRTGSTDSTSRAPDIVTCAQLAASSGPRIQLVAA
jgi:hypothetical protein